MPRFAFFQHLHLDGQQMLLPTEGFAEGVGVFLEARAVHGNHLVIRMAPQRHGLMVVAAESDHVRVAHALLAVVAADCEVMALQAHAGRSAP